MDAKKGAAVVLNGNGDAGTVAHLARTSEIGQIGKTLPVKKAFLTAQVVGSGGNVKILHYSFNKLVQVSALATVFVKGTVFNLDRAVHVAMFSYYVIFALAGGGLYFLGDPLAFEEQSLPPIIEISNDLQRLCPFLFGLFSSLILSRWWALRTTAIGAVCDYLINISGMTASVASRYLIDDNDFELFKSVHARIVKFGLASMSCIVMESRRSARGGEDDQSHGLDGLVSLGLLTEEEKTLLEGARSLPTTLWCWIQAMAAEVMEMMSVPPPNVNMLYQEIRLAMEGVHNVQHYIQTQLPFPYVHMITLLVNVNGLVISIVAGLRVAIAVEKGQTALQIFVSASKLVAVPLMYQGMLQICVFLSDPFGDDIIDFPIRQYQKECGEACEDHLSTRAFYEQRWIDGTAPLPKARVERQLPKPPSIQEPAPAAASPAAAAAPLGQLENRLELLEQSLGCLANSVNGLHEGLQQSTMSMAQSAGSLQSQIKELSALAASVAMARPPQVLRPGDWDLAFNKGQPGAQIPREPWACCGVQTSERKAIATKPS